MKEDAIRSIIIGNIEAIDQGVSLLRSLNDAQYTFTDSPYIQSSIGQHFRHIIDMFLAVCRPAMADTVNYDKRRRGDVIERSRAVAIEELQLVKDNLSEYLRDLKSAGRQLETPITLVTEVTIEDTHSASLPSTKIRELVFTSSHAVHHYALISIIAKIQGVKLDKRVGVAPATATFLRSEALI
ncbi:MAG: DinB family protein [Agarilytica sp.]